MHKVAAALTGAALLAMLTACHGQGITTNNPGPGHPLQESDQSVGEISGHGSQTFTSSLSVNDDWKTSIDWSCSLNSGYALVTVHDAASHRAILDFGDGSNAPKIGSAASSKTVSNNNINEEIYFTVKIGSTCDWTVNADEVTYH